MPHTLVQKILARAAGRAEVAPGDIVTVRADLIMAHDSSGPRRWMPHLEALGAPLKDPSKIVLVTDHFVPAVGPESAAILKTTRDFVRRHGITQFYDMEGISHIVLPEHGLLKPGMFVCGGDSHSPTGGAFGCYMAGFGYTDMVAVAVTGETWVEVPQTIRVEWSGAFGPGVSAKDVMLFLCRELGMDNAFTVAEFGGGAVRAMDMDERMVLTNMAAELGCDTGLIEPDETTLAHIKAHGGSVDADALTWRSDGHAPYKAVHHFEAAALAPHVAAPHSPANSAPVSEHAGQAVDQCYIGACTGAKLTDLHMAAEVLQGRRVSPTMRLLVAPASTKITTDAAADGTLETLTAAGAILLPTGCGACAGLGAGVLADGEVCIASINRNFKGRMGHANSQVYLASAATVAASAVAGEICDPREML